MLNIKYHNKKRIKKFQKNRERTDVHGCTDIGGGWVSLVHENTRNGYTAYCSVAQRFATLVCFVVDDFKRGKTRQRRA